MSFENQIQVPGSADLNAIRKSYNVAMRQALGHALTLSLAEATPAERREARLGYAEGLDQAAGIFGRVRHPDADWLPTEIRATATRVRAAAPGEAVAPHHGHMLLRAGNQTLICLHKMLH